jgi:hypothetical protein
MRVGRVVKANVKGYPEVQSTQGTNAQDTTTNIYVQTILGSSAEVSEAERLDLKSGPLSRKVVVKPPVSTFDLPDVDEPVEEAIVPVKTESTATDESTLELEELPDQNPKLRKFKAGTLRTAEFNIDVSFLRHVIHILITNHALTLTATDIHDIFAYFGEVEVRIKKRKIVERDVEDSGCCGPAHREKIVEVIQKILVLGLNIAKYCPELVKFMGDLGISL